MVDASCFARAIPIELAYEGGKVDDPQDPGGRTNMGVTQRVYTAWRRLHNLPVQDVWLASADEVRAIYKAQYADAVRFDQLRPGVDLVMLDGAINSGPKQAIKWLQAALKRLSLYDAAVDGVFGSGTASAVAAVTDDDALIDLILQFRMGFLHALATWKRFGKGWSARVANLKKIAQAWAMGSVGPDPVDVTADGGHQKAPPPPVDLPLGKVGTAIQGTMGGVGGVVVTQTVSQVKDQLTPFQGVAIVDHTLHILTLISVAIAVGSVLYAGYYKLRTRKATEANDAVLTAPVPA